MKPKVDRVVVALLLIAALVRFPALGKRSLWFDEALSGLIARLSTGEVLTNAAGSCHPPGYYFLLHLWRPMGESEFALRFPSAWFSLLAVALVVRLGRDFFDQRRARLAAVGMAISPFQVYYAQEARMYGLAIALSAGVIWAFPHAIRRNGYEHWWRYVILTALGLYVHYYIGLVVLALHLWLLLDPARASRKVTSLLAADGLAAVAFAPQLAQFLTESAQYLGGITSWQPRPSLLSPLTTLYYLVFGHVLPLRLVGLGLFFVVSLIALAIVSLTRRRVAAAKQLLLLVVSIPILLVFTISFIAHPVYLERSFAVVTPALVLLLGSEVTRGPRRSPSPYLGAALGCLMALGTGFHHIRPDPAKPPIREAIDIVTQEAQATDTVLHLQDASYVPALYYDPATAGSLVDPGQGSWIASATYQLLAGHTLEPANLHVTGYTWLVVMPGYLDAAQTELLERWDNNHAVVKTWGWGADGAGERVEEPIQVRLYGRGETE